MFYVFSGLDAFKDVLEFSDRKNGPIPLGKYWIVDRPKGGLYSRFKQFGKEIRTGNDYDKWFALFKQDSVMDDYTFVDLFQRGNFRLHPLRPDGTGVSDGCITFYNQADFNTIREALLLTQQKNIGSAGLVAYGEINVIGIPRA
ncbi:DUF2778 domain-containing protein [Buttiauxella izardii]|uniref:DUF2778 domain-containing protein n=1 Tax=Buttiauxella izardii TaxID=82991 RepID=UPI001FCA4026|nr:DUF2778 domain-containing protein [Buttiauxella izardii]